VPERRSNDETTPNDSNDTQEDHTMATTQAQAGNTERLYTRRQWLLRSAILNGDARGGVPALMLVREAVSSVAIEHPEWDMDTEQRTWAQWTQDELDG
jgi:hypothetical protein